MPVNETGTQQNSAPTRGDGELSSTEPAGFSFGALCRRVLPTMAIVAALVPETGCKINKSQTIIGGGVGSPNGHVKPVDRPLSETDLARVQAEKNQIDTGLYISSRGVVSQFGKSAGGELRGSTIIMYLKVGPEQYDRFNMDVVLKWRDTVEGLAKQNGWQSSFAKMNGDVVSWDGKALGKVPPCPNMDHTANYADPSAKVTTFRSVSEVPESLRHLVAGIEDTSSPARR